MLDHFDITESKILIVDDEPDNLVILNEILRRAGYRHIDQESDPRNVLERERANHYDLALLDLQMPYLDGFELMQLLHGHEANEAHVIMLTANHDQDVCHSALSNGAKDFVTKPFDHKEVLYRIANVLESRAMQKQLARQNAQLMQSCESRAQELLSSRLHAIQCLGKAAEYRDNETGLHVLRMSKTATRVAQELGWSDDQCELLSHASPMHDIGKIGIPDHVLLKPAPLNAEEWVIMRTHTTIGAQILSVSDSELFQTAAEIAATHHERWDGAGYPHGLAGEAIPIMSRVVAISDTFDALISTRPYKSAWPIERAVDYIRLNRGKQFDPRITDAFLSCIDDVLSISNHYADHPLHTNVLRPESQTEHVIN